MAEPTLEMQRRARRASRTGYTAISLADMISLYAANTVDGGQVSSIRPTLSRQVARIRRARSAQSKYRSVSERFRHGVDVLGQEVRDLAVGVLDDSPTARWMSHRNGTSAWHTETRSGRRAAAAEARPPPWLAPATAIRVGSIPSSAAATSTARAASVNSRA